LTEKEKSILFLRAVRSRATLALPAFYLYLGVRFTDGPEGPVSGYPGVVLRHVVGFSSIGTVALAASKAFENGQDGLTGAKFGKCADPIIEEIADHWTQGTDRPRADALAALDLLRSTFRKFSVSGRNLIDQVSTPLGQRIGLLKEYRNEEAAHLGSMGGYEFSILDCAHVVAALALVGSIITSFDEPTERPTYFDELDQAAASAAKQLFPSTPDIRLFQSIDTSEHSRLCWLKGADLGLQMIDQDLLYALGWH
jgi:hypothetical protein